MSESGRDSARLRSDEHPLGYIEEILINILPRLPAKTVTACKSVAKHFLKLISEPGFPLMHFTMSKRKLKYIICPYPLENAILNNLFVMEDGEISEGILLPGVVGESASEISCFPNGLVCSVHEDNFRQKDVDILIFNACTLDTVRLPRGSTSVAMPRVGVAFDPINNDYKAYRFFSDSAERVGNKYKCEVYTASSKEWRTIAEEVKRPEHSLYHHPLCPCYASVGGTMYWFVWSDGDSGTPASIISVDMNNIFTEIKLPTELVELSFLIEFEGCLAVVHMNSEISQPYMEVFKLEKGGWNLRLRTMITVDLSDVECFSSVAAVDNEIFFIVQLEDKSFYIIFDCVEDTFQTLNGPFMEGVAYYCLVAFPYAESLLCPSEM